MSELQDRNEKRFPLRTALIVSLAGLALSFSILFILSPEASSQKFSTGTKTIENGASPAAQTEPEGPKVNRYDFRLNGHNTFYQILSVVNVPGPEILDIVRKAKPIYDLRQLKGDSIIRVFTVDGKLQKIEYKFNDYEFLMVERSPDGTIKASKSELPHETRQAVISGTIENSFYGDAVKAGADPQTVMGLTDIFAWDVDFASDIKNGDTFSILTDVLYVEGVPVKTGKILGAEMVNNGKRYTALYYQGKDGSGYYDADGKSLRRTLLKSPLRFRRVTSYFTNSRFHPILKRFRPHHGIDYGAPLGTPIEAAGSGVVKFAGWKGGYGNFIEVRHNNGYTTGYGHLSRISKGVRAGSKIDQGEVIGYVGSTGISTGPHLHYEVHLKNALINPLSIKAVADNAISKKDRQKFASLKDEVMKKLSSGGTAIALDKKR